MPELYSCVIVITEAMATDESCIDEKGILSTKL